MTIFELRDKLNELIVLGKGYFEVYNDIGEEILRVECSEFKDELYLMTEEEDEEEED